MNKTVRFGLISAIFAGACIASPVAFAAREFTPQAGTWIITSEQDGQPGRGMAIDVQGNTFFMQVFNYVKDGSATFHTAMGQMDGNSVTAELKQYRGGRYFGGASAVAHEEGSVGQVKLTFQDGLSGTIQFPGEQPQTIQRMLLEQGDPVYRNLMAPEVVDGWTPQRTMDWVGKDANGARNLWRVSMYRESAGVFALEISDPNLATLPPGNPAFLPSVMKMRCAFTESTQVYDCARVVFDSGEWVQRMDGE